MIIAIASGKGGTGKTTVATNLAAVAGTAAAYLDCDVEEPNGHLFLHPVLEPAESVVTLVPRIDFSRCTFCGKCREVCRYNALAVLPKTVLVFDELCHGCGGCKMACPTGAIHEEPREIGVVERGQAYEVAFVHGRMRVGEAKSPPLIHAVKRRLPDRPFIFVDAPPGTSCPVIAALKGADRCLLVTEPTPFGLNDLRLAADTVRRMNIPCGVIVNRAGIGDDCIRDFCRENEIPLLLELPDDRRVAEAYSSGRLATEVIPEWRERFVRFFGYFNRAFNQPSSARPNAPEIEHGR